MSVKVSLYASLTEVLLSAAPKDLSENLEKKLLEATSKSGGINAILGTTEQKEKADSDCEAAVREVFANLSSDELKVAYIATLGTVVAHSEAAKVKAKFKALSGKLMSAIKGVLQEDGSKVFDLDEILAKAQAEWESELSDKQQKEPAQAL